jgi:hypothetical protein
MPFTVLMKRVQKIFSLFVSVFVTNPAIAFTQSLNFFMSLATVRFTFGVKDYCHLIYYRGNDDDKTPRSTSNAFNDLQLLRIILIPQLKEKWIEISAYWKEE